MSYYVIRRRDNLHLPRNCIHLHQRLDLRIRNRLKPFHRRQRGPYAGMDIVPLYNKCLSSPVYRIPPAGETAKINTQFR